MDRSSAAMTSTEEVVKGKGIDTPTAEGKAKKEAERELRMEK